MHRILIWTKENGPVVWPLITAFVGSVVWLTTLQLTVQASAAEITEMKLGVETRSKDLSEWRSAVDNDRAEMRTDIKWLRRWAERHDK